MASRGHPKILKFLRKLQRDISCRIVLKVKSIIDDPFKHRQFTIAV